MTGAPVMERDFLGLLTAKEEDTVDYAQTKESRMQWSFSNVSGPSQYMSFWGSCEDGTRKNVHDQFDSNQRSSSVAVQKNVLMEKSVGTPQPTSVYPGQPFIAPSITWSNEMKMYPTLKQLKKAATVTMSPSVVSSRVSTVGQNVISSPISPQPLGGVLALPPVSVLSTTGSVIGSTDLRTGHKHHGSPAQLTIFYAGSVTVYNDVSPEKAQAIMLLAGNGPPVAHNKTVPPAEVSGPFMKPVRDERSNGNKAVSPAFLSFPGAVSVSPVSVSPQSVSSSQGKPICSLELASRPLDAPVIAHQEPPKTTQSLVTTQEPLFSSVALPQARKASLARFLEKRKERVTAGSPYPVNCKSPESSISKV